MNTSELHPGQLVMVNIEGSQLDAAQAQFLRAQRIRAVCLFRGNIVDAQQTVHLTRDLRDALGPQALIAIDQEGGSVVRATFLPQAPAAMALGAAADARLAEAVGNGVGRGIRSLGFNWNFAPVLDVNNNPANPVIAERSFGADPAQVARLAGAWMRGAQRAGVACCVKHFPGHGDTHVDSHRDLPVVDKPMEVLRRFELAPFIALLDQAPAIMTAHIVYPQLDARYPATLSGAILGDLLRRELGYDGVVITDSLVMKAIHERYGHDRAAVLALQAGADMVMALGSRAEQAAAVQAVAAAAGRGELSAQALARARRRLDGLAQRFPVGWPQYRPDERAADEVVMAQAWQAGLTALGSPRAPGVREPLEVLTQRAVPSDGVSEAGLDAQALATLFAGLGDLRLIAVDDLDTLDWSTLAGDARFRILVSNRHARYGPRSRQWRPDLHLALWNPYHVLDVDAPAVLSWGYADGALVALRQWLQGRGPAPGRAPVDLRGLHASH